jgi:sec-independent protein translocase protein TatA
LFGKKLPEVAKSLGKNLREFRKGLSDIQSSLDREIYGATSSVSSSYDNGSSTSPQSSNDGYDDYDEPSAPKFEPPPSEPQVAASETPPGGEASQPKPVD